MSLYRHILVAFDGSPTSERALQEAIRLARFHGARLLVLHVVDELSHVSGFETAATYLDDMLPRMRAQGQKLLARACRMAGDAGVHADSVLIAGQAGRLCDHVAAQAARAGADLIVLGSHGRRGMGRLLLGSDAEQIVRHAPVPVLVVRATAGDKACAAPDRSGDAPLLPA